MNDFTPFSEVNAILQPLLAEIRALLGEHLVGMYLDGSLANGDFDSDSDIDFVVALDQEVDEDLFTALRAMHERIAALDSPWAIQLEGSYLSQGALRRHDPRYTHHPNLERGQGERLKWAEHGEIWNVHRAILRERGIPLTGPAPATLIDPVTPDDLRRAMRPALHGWATYLLDHPEELCHRGYQSYTALSICRILYTLQTGAVASKPKAANWAQQTLDEQWHGLLERAWVGRHTPQWPASAEDIQLTLALIRYAVDRAGAEEIALARPQNRQEE